MGRAQTNHGGQSRPAWEPKLGWPEREDQNASYCGDMHELIVFARAKYATSGGMSTTQVKRWLEKNPSFIPRWLRGKEWAVDHVVSDKLGAHPWPYNYFLMPKEDNSHFREWADQEKRKYVGSHAWETSSSFARWARDAARARIDYSRFDPVTDQFRGRA